MGKLSETAPFFRPSKSYDTKITLIASETCFQRFAGVVLQVDRRNDANSGDIRDCSIMRPGDWYRRDDTRI